MADMQDANAVFEGVAEDVTEINKRIIQAEILITAMKEAGEDASTLEADIRTLKMRRDKWVRMLNSRGFKVK